MGAGGSAGVCGRLRQPIVASRDSGGDGGRSSLFGFSALASSTAGTAGSGAAAAARGSSVKPDEDAFDGLERINSINNCVAARYFRGPDSNAVVERSRLTAASDAEATIRIEPEDGPLEFQRYMQTYVNTLEGQGDQSFRTARKPPGTAHASADNDMYAVRDGSAGNILEHGDSTRGPYSALTTARLAGAVQAAAAAAPNYDTLSDGPSLSRSLERRQDASAQRQDTARSGDVNQSPSPRVVDRSASTEALQSEYDYWNHPQGDATHVAHAANATRSRSFMTDAVISRLDKGEEVHHKRDAARAAHGNNNGSHNSNTSVAVLDLNLPRGVRRSVNKRDSGTDPNTLRECDSFSDADTLVAHNQDGHPSSIVLPSPSLVRARQAAKDKNKKKFVPNITAFEYS